MWRRRQREDDPGDGLEQIAASERLAAERRSTRAAAPLSNTERHAAAERIAAQQRGAPEPARRCETCGSPIREVVEHGVSTAWCPGCARYVGPDPRHVAARAAGATAGGAFVAGYAETGPDSDGDGDVDGGLLDSLGDLLG